MKKTTLYLFATVLLLITKTSLSQDWIPVFNFNSVNGQIVTSNGDKIFTYQAYNYMNDSYEAMLSLDNGSTWTQVHDDKFAAAFFNSQEDLYIVRQDNFPGTNLYFPQSIFLTNDDGSSWTTIDTVADNMGQVNASVFRMDNRTTLYTGFRNFSANTGGFKYSTDDGGSWTLIPTFTSGPASYKDVFSALLSSNGDFFITTYNSGVYKSSDAGENWRKVYDTFITLGYLNEYPTTGDLYVASFGAILKSTDNGENWEEIIPDPWMAMNIKEFEITANGTFYFANSGGVFKSEDCIHWESIWNGNGKGSRTTALLDMAISDNYIYVSAIDSTVYRRPLENTSAINDIPDRSILSIYPNPANDIVNIKLDNTVSNRLKNELSISDINGRLVRSIDFSVQTDTYQVNIIGIRPGLYMLNLNTGNRNYKQKLMISK